MPKRENQGDGSVRPSSRGSKLLGVLWRVGLVLVVVAGAMWWQARNLLPSGEPSPRMALRDLEGSSVELGVATGRPEVLYFFAPWCGVCESSSANIASLRESRGEGELGIVAIGLDYDDPAEIRRFAGIHGLGIPVLLGDDETRRAFRVGSYPTIYILDREGRIDHRLVGYTTSLGLKLRLLFI